MTSADWHPEAVEFYQKVLSGIEQAKFDEQERIREAGYQLARLLPYNLGAAVAHLTEPSRENLAAAILALRDERELRYPRGAAPTDESEGDPIE